MLYKKLGNKFTTGIKTLIQWALAFYKVVISPHTGGACRFYPSCSQYAEEAFKVHNPLQAFYLTLARILKCFPGGPKGYDPVPPKKGKSQHATT